ELGLPFAMALDAALGGGVAPQAEFLREAKVSQFLMALAEELNANKGRAVVLAGRRQPREVHALVAKINQTLAAPGQVLDYLDDPEPDRPRHVEAISALAKAIDAGGVKTLFIL